MVWEVTNGAWNGRTRKSHKSFIATLVNVPSICSECSEPSWWLIIYCNWASVYTSSEKAMAPHSSTLAWKIPWMEEPGRLQSMGLLRVGHDWATSLYFSLSCIGEGNGNPLQCSCLENPRDGGASWAAVYGVAQSRTWLKWLSIYILHGTKLEMILRLCDNLHQQVGIWYLPPGFTPFMYLWKTNRSLFPKLEACWRDWAFGTYKDSHFPKLFSFRLKCALLK